MEPTLPISSLNASHLMRDPRLAQAKNLILEAVNDAQKNILGVRSPNPALKEYFEGMLKQLSEFRSLPLFFPYLGSGCGKGALVELLDGSVKYDLISGIGVHYFGHQNPHLILSGIEAAIADTVIQGHLQQNSDTLDISTLLIQASGLDHCFLSTSGAMANENALKIIFQKKYPAQRLLAFEHCFMGRTLALAQITDKPAYRDRLPNTLPIDYVPFYDHTCPEESLKKTLKILHAHLERYPKQHACMCFELILGEGGVYPGTAEFFKPLMQVLKEHDIAIFVDEVQTFGRTSSLFAYQHFGLTPFVDVVSLGKVSLTCATLFTEAYKPKPGLLSQTFTSSTSAIRASHFVISEILNQGYLGPEGKIMRMHREFKKRLESIEMKYPQWLRGPYGIGGMVGFTVFDGSSKRTTDYIHALFEAGIIAFTAGSNPYRVRFLLPIGALHDNDLDPIFQIIEETLVKLAKT